MHISKHSVSPKEVEEACRSRFWVRKAKRMLGDKVYLVTGGFHLMAYRESEVKEIIKQLKKLGVKKVGPSHCTGGRPIELFKKAWGKDFISLGCGAKVKIQ